MFHHFNFQFESRVQAIYLAWTRVIVMKSFLLSTSAFQPVKICVWTPTCNANNSLLFVLGLEESSANNKRNHAFSNVHRHTDKLSWSSWRAFNSTNNSGSHLQKFSVANGIQHLLQFPVKRTIKTCEGYRDFRTFAKGFLRYLWLSSRNFEISSWMIRFSVTQNFPIFWGKLSQRISLPFVSVSSFWLNE